MTDVLEIRRRQDGVAVLVFDDPQRPLNLLCPDLIDDFDRTLTELLDEPEIRACVLVSGKESSFIVGADVHVLDGMESAEEASAFSRRGNALLRRLEQSPKPVVAAVHGTCVGGGLEVALACHAIVATEHPDTVLALPEVQIGLLPGGGGTQRLPRRIGLAAARKQAYLDLRKSQNGIRMLSRNNGVTGQRYFQSPSDAGPVHRRYHGLGRLL